MTTMQEIEKLALELPVKERELLVTHLLQSIQTPNQELTDTDKAWLDEAETRYQEYLKNPSSAVSHKVFTDQIRSEFGWK